MDAKRQPPHSSMPELKSVEEEVPTCVIIENTDDSWYQHTGFQVFAGISAFIMFIVCWVYSSRFSTWLAKHGVDTSLRGGLKNVNDAQVASWFFFPVPILSIIPVAFFCSRVDSLPAGGGVNQAVI